MTQTELDGKTASEAGTANDTPLDPGGSALDPEAFDWPPAQLIAEDFIRWLQAVLRQPGEFAAFVKTLDQAWLASLADVLAGTGDPGLAPRYRHPAWTQEPHLRLAARLHQDLFGQLRDLLAATDELCPAHRRRMAFWLRHLEAACCPAHNLWLSPEVRERAQVSEGRSVRRGIELLQADVARSRYRLRMARQPAHAFELGVDLAATPAHRIFRNELVEVLCYDLPERQRNAPPLLMVPPCINRYYVLDLKPENSLVRWCLGQGRPVYMIVWADGRQQGPDWSFADYVAQGVEAAFGAVCAHERRTDVDMLGYCIGGTMAACHAAWRGARGEPQPKTLTLLTTLLDFADPGDLGVFIDAEQLDRLAQHLRRCGIMSGELLRRAFELLQPEELMWSIALNRYGLGRENKPHELLFWSDDNPALPGRMIIDYLRGCYLENRLTQPGRLRMAGQGIDLRALGMPVMLVAAEADHIAPWRSVLAGGRLLTGVDRFILGGGGHIGGIVNPPARQRLGYCVAPWREQAEDWQQSSDQKAGSWWPEWDAWLRER